MDFRRALPEDLTGILRLQSANLRGSLNLKDQQEGFLSAEFTRRHLVEIASEIALLVASDKGQVLGYLCSYSCVYSKQFPILATMMRSFDHILYRAKPLSFYKAFVYGPVCIDKTHRGRGLLRGLYATLLKEVGGRYEVGVAFVSKDNPHSLTVHVNGLGMAIAGEFEFRRRNYDILAFSVES
ncbi:MAG: GNAT family N-acetyltransferase [Candidatus Binatia bacterium]